MNPQLIMQGRYPKADFTPYFSFLAACRSITKHLEHEHHICPRKQFPEHVKAPWNKIRLSAADHAFAHRLLGAAVPDMIMGTAWIERQRIAAVRGGTTQGLKNRENKTGVCGRSPSKISADAVYSGHLGGAATKRNGTGIFSLTPEQHLVSAAKGGRRGGARGGRKTRELGVGIFSPELDHAKITSEGWKKGLHNRWHVNRGITKPGCKWCKTL